MIVPDRHDPRTVGDATWAVHGGNAVDGGSGAIRTPIIMANAYLLPDDPSGIDWSNPEQLLYTRTTGANQQALEAKLAAMDGAIASSSCRLPCHGWRVRAEAAADFQPGANGRRYAARRSRSSMSSATAMRETPARLWTEASWKATRTACSRA